jgi:phospholipid/cholesterol/gamma-HCH transport system permease protein
MAEGGDLSLSRPDDTTLIVRLAGAWQLRGRLPSLAAVEREVGSRPPRRLAFDTRGLTAWDSSLLAFLGRVTDLCQRHGIAADRAGLPAGLRRLLELAEAVPEKKDARAGAAAGSFLARVGTRALGALAAGREMLAFLGEVTRALGRCVRGRARFRAADLFLVIQQCGAEALPIVTLISFLVGLILAFVGAIQLEQFGAQIYVANLVGLAMVREMGAMMTAIIMAGRTGAAFAAQLGTMRVTQEIDALATMGIPPMEFLVLPRVLALSLMLPLLCVYADVLGMVGGLVVGAGMLDLSATQYVLQTTKAMTLVDCATGVFKSAVFGVLVALSGCLRGMQCASSASAVGDAATSAVVTAIVCIIVTDGLFAVVFDVLGI